MATLGFDLGGLLKAQHEQMLEKQALLTTSTAQLNANINNVGGTMVIQNALSAIPELKGKGEITPWLDELEKCRICNDLPDMVMGKLAWQRSSGTVASFIRRQMVEKPTQTWVELRTALEKEFGKVVDEYQSFTLFAALRQRRDEDVGSFTERFLTLGQATYKDGWNVNETAKTQALAVYMEGLRSQEMKTRIFKSGVKTLDEAIKMAKFDDLCRRRFGGSLGLETLRREEPMEVGSHRRSSCYHCGGAHRSKDCRRSVQSMNKKMFSQRERDRRDRRCYVCHRTGHFAAQCRNGPLN